MSTIKLFYCTRNLPYNYVYILKICLEIKVHCFDIFHNRLASHWLGDMNQNGGTRPIQACISYQIFKNK